MTMQTCTFILLLAAVISVHSVLDGELAFKEVCTLYTNRIKAGIFDKAFKAMNDCREKNLSKDAIGDIDKCESVLPMIKADQVIKICNEINANKDKFTQVFDCSKRVLGDDFEKLKECSVVYERSKMGANSR